MGYRHTWRGAFERITHGLGHQYEENVCTGVESSVSAVVKLGPGAPARHAGRTVTVSMSPEHALDWSAEIASHARTARRQAHESGTRTYQAPRGENLTRYVERLVRDFAEDTGVQDDDRGTQVLDLMVELLRIAGQDGVDLEWLTGRACAEATCRN